MYAPRVAMLAYDGAGSFDYVTVYEIFGVDYSHRFGSWYRTITCAETPGSVRLDSGVAVDAPYGLEDAIEADLVVVPGWTKEREVPPRPLLATSNPVLPVRLTEPALWMNDPKPAEPTCNDPTPSVPPPMRYVPAEVLVPPTRTTPVMPTVPPLWLMTPRPVSASVMLPARSWLAPINKVLAPVPVWLMVMLSSGEV